MRAQAWWGPGIVGMHDKKERETEAQRERKERERERGKKSWVKSAKCAQQAAHLSLPNAHRPLPRRSTNWAIR